MNRDNLRKYSPFQSTPIKKQVFNLKAYANNTFFKYVIIFVFHNHIILLFGVVFIFKYVSK